MLGALWISRNPDASPGNFQPSLCRNPGRAPSPSLETASIIYALQYESLCFGPYTRCPPPPELLLMIIDPQVDPTGLHYKNSYGKCLQVEKQNPLYYRTRGLIGQHSSRSQGMQAQAELRSEKLPAPQAAASSPCPK